jgi:hypothetical protein
MQASFTHMMRDFKATSCFLHVRCSNAAALPLYRDALGFRVVKTEVNVVFLQSACICRLRLHSMFFPVSSCLRESKDSTRRCRVYKASRCVVVTAARRSRSRRRQTTLFCWMQQQNDDCGCDLSERILRRRRRCSIYARSSRFLQSALSMKITETLTNRPHSLPLLPPPILAYLPWLR